MTKRCSKILFLMILTAILCCASVFATSMFPGESRAAVLAGWDEDAYAVINDTGELWIFYETNTRGNTVLTRDVKMTVSLNRRELFVLKNDGSLWVYNSKYDDNALRFNFSDPIRLLDGITKISNNGLYDCNALAKDGTLYHIDNAEVMTPTYADYEISVLDTGVTAVAGNEDINLYYLKGDEVWTYSGQSHERKKTLSFSDGKEIYVYKDTFYVLTEDGDLYSWGSNKRGQVGNGGEFDYEERRLIYVTATPQSQDFSVSLFVTKPCKVLEDVVEFWSGEEGALFAVDADGDTWIWGYGENAMCYYDATTGTFGPTRFPDNKDGYSPVRTAADAKYVGFSYYNLKFDKNGTIWHYFGSFNGAEGNWKKLGTWKSGGAAAQKPSAPVSSGQAFTDVPRGMYCYDSVDWAVEEGITAGTTKTTFSPARTCSQAEILTFLWRAAGSPEPWIDDPYGLTEGTYYYDAMLWAYEAGVVNDWSLSPNAPCTRSDVVTYLWRLSGCPYFESSGAFTDVSYYADYAQAVDWAVAENITSGTSATTFAPDKTCTRGEIATFLYRYFA